MSLPKAPDPSPQPAASCLHLVVGAGEGALGNCLTHAGAADAILFVDAGVLHLLQAASAWPDSSQTPVFYSATDLHAHGLFSLARRLEVNILDDDGFCDLLAAHRHCLTWV
jgi:sulfur relay protein TusB/DsrH